MSRTKKAPRTQSQAQPPPPRRGWGASAHASPTFASVARASLEGPCGPAVVRVTDVSYRVPESHDQGWSRGSCDRPGGLSFLSAFASQGRLQRLRWLRWPVGAVAAAPARNPRGLLAPWNSAWRCPPDLRAGTRGEEQPATSRESWELPRCLHFASPFQAFPALLT